MDAIWNRARRPYQPSPWTDEAVARLRALVLAGQLTRTQIAQIFGLSKSAICGMVWRLGLADKRRPPKPVPRHRIRNRKPRPKAPRRPRPIPEVATMILVPVPSPPPEAPQEPLSRPPDAPPAPACDFHGLGFRTCRWPLWDHTGHVPFAEQWYCGDEPIGGGAPYCEAHSRLAFAPSRPPARGRMLAP